MPEIWYFMKYIRLHSTNPYDNLAVEEYLLTQTDEDVFMLWQNEPTVVIGKNQNAYAEVSLDVARAEGIHVARRLSGGGAVYHDLGNVNFSMITEAKEGNVLDYARFTRPISEALASLGVKACLSGRNDLECDGKKISGNAQVVRGGRILHHGTLLFDTDASVMSRVLRIDREKVAHRAVASHKGRVGNIAPLLSEACSVCGFMDRLERFVLDMLGARASSSPPSAEQIAPIARRLASDEWIYSNKRYLTEYGVERKVKYPFGVVCLSMTLSGERVEDVRISGDFFGREPIELLEKQLRGCSLRNLPTLDPSPYIAGMTEANLVALLRGE